VISFVLIKGEALLLCTRRSTEPHIDKETVSIAPQFHENDVPDPRFSSVMNDLVS